MHSVNMDNMNSLSNLAGVILAGGKSSRMDQDKAQVIYKNRPLLEHMQGLLNASGVGEIYISRQNHVADIIPNSGPLGGIYSILQNINEEEILILPIDMPLLSPSLLQKLINANYADALIYEGYNLPLKLRTSDRLKNIIKQKLLDKEKSLSIKSLLAELDTKTLKLSNKDKKLFINVNTTQELEKIS